MKKINTALISVFYKDGLEEIVRKLHELGVTLLSTGGTYDFITSLDIPAQKVEDLTSYPSILGGRVKTLHPKVFGGILARRDLASDQQHLAEYKIPEIDLVIVDLYPFEETVANTHDEKSIIEKIDIGGISLIRAAAKNYKDVVIVPSSQDYTQLHHLISTQDGCTTLQDRKQMAARAFAVSSNYDTAIFNYFNETEQLNQFRASKQNATTLRYGENPHQKGDFFGDLNEVFTQLHGKAISYNNLVDIDAGIHLIKEFSEPTFAVLKHTNACGVATRKTICAAWSAAFAGDPVSAYGGVLIANRSIDKDTATEINKIFFEVILAPEYTDEALTLLKSKKNRIILKQNEFNFSTKQFRSMLNGVLQQDKDLRIETPDDLQAATNILPTTEQTEDLLFANKLVKHTKSNAIVLVKNKQLIGSGTGQTSRIDALRHAIEKAHAFDFDTTGAVMASDAFFPFADSVETADKAGIKAVIQPGGSVRDSESVKYCNENSLCMVFTGIRHFKH